MKPADRALDIVAVGLGQGGGNIAAEFSRLGYRAMAFNTAHTDLSALAPGDAKNILSREQRVYIGLDGYDGAGADLNYGRECIRENAERIRDTISAHAEGADIVVFSAGLGGGTGSALSELVDVVEELGLPLITLATLPGDHESGIAKVNAARGVSELVKRTPYGWIFIDNQRLSQIHGSVSLDKYFERINEVIVAPLDALNRINDRKGVYPIRTLDGEDLRKLLLSSGVLNYADTLLPSLTVDSVSQGVSESLQSSSVMPAGYSLEEVAYMGVVVEAPAETLASTPFSFFEQLSEQLKGDTGGGAIYLGVYRMPELEGGAARVRLVASSQSLPTGIQAIVNDAKREGSTLRDKLRRAVDSLDLGEIEEFDLFKTHTRSSPPSRKRNPRALDLELEQESLPGKVGTRSGEVQAAKEAAAASDDHAPDIERSEARFTVSAQQEAVAHGMAATPTPPQSGAVAKEGAEDAQQDSAEYAKLADAFLSADSISIRRRIARRLQAAQSSDSPLERYYAGHAVEKIKRVAEGAYDEALADEAARAAEN